MDRIQFIIYKGRQVLLLDFTQSTPEEVKSFTDRVEQMITAQPRDSVLVVADFSGAQFTKEVVTA